MAQEKQCVRLDKAVSAQTEYSRREVHRLASAGKITVNGRPVRVCDEKIDLARDLVVVDGQPLVLSRYSYLMLNKPRGVVCATEDAALPTVLDLVPPALLRTGLFPAGRLDKDTEGFVLITNDGELSHRILSPKSHLPKTYLAVLDKPFDESVARAFAEGVVLRAESTREHRVQATRGSRTAADDATDSPAPIVCMPVALSADGGDYTRARVVLRQGLYHQIKRMFAAYGLTVTALRREKIGGLSLDETLEAGQCRMLTPDEVSQMLAEE